MSKEVLKAEVRQPPMVSPEHMASIAAGKNPLAAARIARLAAICWRRLAYRNGTTRECFSDMIMTWKMGSGTQAKTPPLDVQRFGYCASRNPFVLSPRCIRTSENIDMTSTSGAKMALEKELETYKNKLSELKVNEGKFVLIQGENVVDTFTSYDDALKEGYKRFGLTPFLVKQILAIEPVFSFTRPLGAIHSSR